MDNISTHIVAIGALFVWFLRITGPFRGFWQQSELLEELRDCDTCLSFWVYLLLAVVWKKQTLWPEKLPKVVDAIATAAVLSFIYTLLRAGWNERFRELVIVTEVNNA